MARKNMFEGLTPPTPTPEDSAAQQSPRPAPEVFQQSGPIAAIRNDLRSVGARSVQEIEPSLIEDTGLTDRIGDLDDDIAELRDSISRHGQQVPILLRPHPTLSGRYQVVYGRRRLTAIKGLGTTVKALIRTLSDEEAVLAQGQENNLRKDPSFIEKTLFAGELEDAGYEARIIQDALNISRSHTSHMRKVREAFPRVLIEKIGASPSIGWKRWYELATKVLERGVDPNSVSPAPFPANLTSDQRFDHWLQAFESSSAATLKQPKKAASVEIQSKTGAKIGSLASGKNKVTFQADATTTAFADWIAGNASSIFQRLHQEYLDQTDNQD
ncbi:chromosome partitioning protein, ParB family [Pseudorhodobacter antarcticus]|uniref:Chromosome partitioning protein, ParB family n=1 Tax=Pseudorhodobacter antarcticus TaxID=1077947 RepID=A0A1H8MYF7_9RHOB|nr:plasmid partitioning protein RepB [Pseudorhodobacter antarcticus]SEO22296.1 chromosome partitioning protein, ParB family [Pseudorhodobacter antarcticus]